MPQPEWMEIPVFIHGITPNPEPRLHDPDYDRLFELIQASLKEKGKPPFQEAPIRVEWGWDSNQTVENDRYLALAEKLVAEQAIAIERGTPDFSFNLLRLINPVLRQMFLYGFADLFYYVSHDGEWAVRQNVFSHLVNQVFGREAYRTSKVSLTLIAHSAGSVIAHDLLYHLFRDQASEVEMVNELRTQVELGRLRIRRFYTFGSPITPLIFRTDALLLKIFNRELLDPAIIGLKAGNNLSNPRWVNFWDKDDLAAYPVAFLYKNEAGIIKDQYLNLGDDFPSVHAKYWTSKLMANYIAETF